MTEKEYEEIKAYLDPLVQVGLEIVEPDPELMEYKSYVMIRHKTWPEGSETYVNLNKPASLLDILEDVITDLRDDARDSVECY